MIDTESMIDVTEYDLAALIKNAYTLSVPMGLGMLHFKAGPLSDEQVCAIIEAGAYHSRSEIAVNMDYVNGRAVKLTVFRKEDRLYIRKEWYDHSDADLKELLARTPKCLLAEDDDHAE